MSSPPQKKQKKKLRVGIVGYGHLGQYLATWLLDKEEDKEMELAFVWNRSADKILEDKRIPPEVILKDLDQFRDFHADLIVEVAHPSISQSHGVSFLSSANYMIGSPTALADRVLEASLRHEAARPTGFGLYIPVGALWGAQDIKKMADRGTLKNLTVTMKKAPHHMKLDPPLDVKVLEAEGFQGETVVYAGSVRDLCPLAPNNVNTMAAAAIAGHNLGLDKVKAVLIADPRLEKHVIVVEVEGPGSETNKFHVETVRSNPAAKGAVTGAATYASFLSSTLLAHGEGDGVFLC